MSKPGILTIQPPSPPRRMPIARHLALVLSLVASAALPAQSARSTSVLAITGVTVVDPDADAPALAMTVVVSGDRITSVRPSREAAPPAGATVIDGRGRYVIPGLWDAHVHVLTGGDSTNRLSTRAATTYFPQYLAHGVTSLRDLGSWPDTLAAMQRDLASGRVLGPRLVGASQLLGGPNRWAPASSHAILVTAPDSAAGAVRRIRAQGGQFVKAHDMLTRDAFFAIAAAAKEAGLPLVGHFRPGVTVDEAIAAGQVGVEHLPIEIVAACAPGDARASADRWYQQWIAGGWGAYVDSTATLWARRDPARCAAVLQRMRDARVHVTPTLVLRLQDSTFHARTGAPLRRTEQHERGCRVETENQAGLTPAQHRTHGETVRSIVGALHRAGVPLLAGSDGPGACLTPGAALHEELRALGASGLSPRDVLRSATVLPARFLDATSRLGTIAAGAPADLVLLDADPLADVDHLRRIRGVMTQGRWLDRATLDAMLQAR